MKYTTDQTTALDAIGKWVAAPMHTVLTLEGYAGTGKTTIVKEILANTAKPFTLAAPTNKAAAVLSRATGEHAITLHSAINLRMATDAETKYLQPTKGTKKKIPQNGLLIVDEASMVGNSLFRATVAEAEKAGCVVLFAGDPMQLPPVKEAYAPAFNHPKVQLTEVVRQAQGSPVIAWASYLRTVINGTYGEAPDVSPPMEWLGSKPWEARFIEAVVRGENVRALCWTNNAVNTLASLARKARFGLSAAPYEVGERLYAAAPYGRVIRTDDEMIVTSVKECDGPYGGSWEVGVEVRDPGTDAVSGNYVCKCARDRATVDNAVQSLKRKATRATKGKEQKAAWKAMHEFADQWADLRSTYAMTVHRSQGSTFPSVFVDCADVGRAPPSEKYKLLYVAFTRTANELVIRR